jgi:hypothetical protein
MSRDPTNPTLEFRNIAVEDFCTSDSKVNFSCGQYAQIFINNGLRMAPVLLSPLWLSWKSTGPVGNVITSSDMSDTA